MSLALLVVVLGAGPVKSLALPDFTVVNVAPEIGRLCSERLATELSSRRVSVITAKQMATMIGIERQKQLLGCDENANNCLAELADALGTEGIVIGDLGRIGSRIQLNLRVTRAGSPEAIATWLGTVAREEDLLEEISRAAKAIADKLIEAPTPSTETRVEAAPQPPPDQPRLARPWPIAPSVVAGVSLVAGAVLTGLAVDRHAHLTTAQDEPITDPAAANALRDQGKGFMYGAWAAWGVATIAVGVGTFMLIRGEAPKVTPSVAVTSAGAIVGVQGVLP